jgi:ribonuclease P protein component
MVRSGMSGEFCSCDASVALRSRHQARGDAGVATTLPDQRRYIFPKSHHLRSPMEFAAVYDAKVRESRGPLLIYAMPNNLSHARIGISTSRKVGTAPRRNKIRRMLRETFRLMQYDFPGAYDFVIVVRPHEPFALPEYQRLISEAVAKLDKVWQRRGGGGGGGRGSRPRHGWNETCFDLPRAAVSRHFGPVARRAVPVSSFV